MAGLQEREPLTGFDGIEALDDEFSLVYPSAISLKVLHWTLSQLN